MDNCESINCYSSGVVVALLGSSSLNSFSILSSSRSLTPGSVLIASIFFQKACRHPILHSSLLGPLHTSMCSLLSTGSSHDGHDSGYFFPCWCATFPDAARLLMCFTMMTLLFLCLFAPNRCTSQSIVSSVAKLHCNISH